MIILSIRTDNPQSEIGLFDGSKELAYEKWQAHRQLAETIHSKIEQILTHAGKTVTDIEGIIAYKGPGSFTGLRIGLSVANALAYSLQKPLVGTTGEDWLGDGIASLGQDSQLSVVSPDYGADAHVTESKK